MTMYNVDYFLSSSIKIFCTYFVDNQAKFSFSFAEGMFEINSKKNSIRT